MHCCPELADYLPFVYFLRAVSLFRPSDKGTCKMNLYLCLYLIFIFIIFHLPFSRFPYYPVTFAISTRKPQKPSNPPLVPSANTSGAHLMNISSPRLLPVCSPEGLIPGTALINSLLSSPHLSLEKSRLRGWWVILVTTGGSDVSFSPPLPSSLPTVCYLFCIRSFISSFLYIHACGSSFIHLHYVLFI